MKIYQYQTIQITDRSHLDDPELLLALNTEGSQCGLVECPVCHKKHAEASGWKHKEDQPKGSDKLCVLLEREVEFKLTDCGRSEF